MEISEKLQRTYRYLGSGASYWFCILLLLMPHLPERLSEVKFILSVSTLVLAHRETFVRLFGIAIQKVFAGLY